MERKLKIEFNEANVQDSVAYVLVSEFDLKPNVLKATIEGDGSGIMILSIEGDGAKLDAAEKRLMEAGFDVSQTKRAALDEGLCWDCGACVSLCPVFCFSHDRDTKEIVADFNKCIACGACVNACSVHALSLQI